MTARRRDPNSWTVVPLPERDLAESLLDVAAPLLEKLGSAPSVEATRTALEVAVEFWNASVLASRLWQYSSPRKLQALRKRMENKNGSQGDAAMFEVLSRRWRKSYAFEPRLIDSWSYESDQGPPRLACSMGLPDGVRIEIPPPIEKRIAIGGKYLEDVRICIDATSYLGFPVERHRATIGPDGSVTVHVQMPTAIQLFAEGRLNRIGGDPVEVVVGGRQLGVMELVELRCGGEGLRYDIAVLVFKPMRDSVHANNESRG